MRFWRRPPRVKDMVQCISIQARRRFSVGKMALKKVYIDSDHAKGIGWYSRRWDIPESELIRRAVVALTRGDIPSEHLLTESDRKRMWREVMQTMEDGSLSPNTEPGEPIWDREAIYRDRG